MALIRTSVSGVPGKKRTVIDFSAARDFAPH
jgi:hypothetical protein